MNDPILAAVLFAVLLFETFLLAISWNKQATNFARIRLDRRSRPKAFWALFVLHAVLIVVVGLVLVDMTMGLRT